MAASTKGWERKILEELLDKYDIHGTSIKEFISYGLGGNPFDEVDSRHVKDIICNLERRGLVKWDTTRDNGNFYEIGTTVNGVSKNFENVYAEIRLTDEGVKYVSELINTKTLQDSTVSVNIWMKRLTLILVLTAVITVIVQIKQCCIEDKQYQLEQTRQQESTERDQQYVPNSDSPEFHNEASGKSFSRDSL